MTAAATQPIPSDTPAGGLAMAVATLAAFLAEHGRRTRRRSALYPRLRLAQTLAIVDGVQRRTPAAAISDGLRKRIARLTRGIRETLQEDGGLEVELGCSYVQNVHDAALALTRLGDDPPEAQEQVKAASTSARPQR